MSEESSEVCRTCLRQGEETRSAHTLLRIAGNCVGLADILATFFQYKVDEYDGLPQRVCLTCIHQLISTYTFNVIAQDSLNKLCDTKVEWLDSNDELQNDDQHSHSENDIKPLLTELKENTDKIIDLNLAKRKENAQPLVLYCVKCKKLFKSAHTLLQHCYDEHAAKRIIGRDCEFCNEKFEDLRSLVIHRKYHMSLYVCQVCWDGFNTKVESHTHSCQRKLPINKDVKTESKRVMRQCDQCGKSYPVGYIKLHMLIHSNETRYSCKYCPKKFKVPCSLNSHVLWNHVRTRNHKCDVCGASFVTASAKSAHKRKHHLQEKKHMCENCGKKFFSKSEMQRHMLTHSGVKSFHCHLCDKSYQTRYGLNVHLKSSNSHSVPM